jgi:hypothetical protein
LALSKNPLSCSRRHVSGRFRADRLARRNDVAD